MFGHTLRGWLAESLELVASRKTFPYKNYHLEPVSFDGFINYYRLNASESRDNKIIVYVFLFFFCIKSKTGALCLITVSLLTKPPWPSKHKMSFCQWAASCGFVFFVRSQLRSDLASEKFKHLRDFLETSNFLIYRLTLNIGNFGSNASINDAWHKKVNNMEMSSVKKVGRHLWINSVSMLFLCSEKPEESSVYGHKCNVCFYKPMYMRVLILLRSFNPPNVAKLKIDHVGIVVWYKHFDRRLIIQALWSSLDNTSAFPSHG